MISTNIIYIDNFDFKITNKNNSIQISIFNNDKVSKQKKLHINILIWNPLNIILIF